MELFSGEGGSVDERRVTLLAEGRLRALGRKKRQIASGRVRGLASRNLVEEYKKYA